MTNQSGAAITDLGLITHDHFGGIQNANSGMSIHSLYERGIVLRINGPNGSIYVIPNDSESVTVINPDGSTEQKVIFPTNTPQIELPINVVKLGGVTVIPLTETDIEHLGSRRAPISNDTPLIGDRVYFTFVPGVVADNVPIEQQIELDQPHTAIAVGETIIDGTARGANYINLLTTTADILNEANNTVLNLEYPTIGDSGMPVFDSFGAYVGTHQQTVKWSSVREVTAFSPVSQLNIGE